VVHGRDEPAGHPGQTHGGPGLGLESRDARLPLPGDAEVRVRGPWPDCPAAWRGAAVGDREAESGGGGDGRFADGLLQHR